MDLFIDSPALSESLVKAFKSDIPCAAYEARLAAGEKRYETEPGAGFFKRTWIGFLSVLPIEWLL
jgi:cardiolipin synthase C